MTAVTTPRRALLLVFWGAVLALPDLRVHGLDLIPDFVGWAVVAVALGRLRATVLDDQGGRERIAIAEGIYWSVAVVSLADVPRPLEGSLAMVHNVLLTAGAVALGLALIRILALVGADRLRHAWAVTLPLVAGGHVLLYAMLALGGSGGIALALILAVVLSWLWYLALLLRTAVSFPR